MMRHEALTLALELAINAATEANKDKAVALADSIAAGMPADEIEQCKAAALLDAATLVVKQKTTQPNTHDL